jgi:hypothetical protein
MGPRRAAAIAFTAVLIGCGVLLTAGANAAFHLTKVREVYPGTALSPDSAFVELQAYAAGQNFLAGHSIHTYDASGAELHEFSIPSAASQGGNQRTFLIADQFPPDAVTGDWTDTALGTNIPPAGGAVCFDSVPVDCVSWGSFAGQALLPGAAGTPVAPGGIPDGSSLTRSIAPGCPTLLESGDDTDQSNADFAVTPDPGPRPNTVAPTEADCVPPETTIDSGPKKKTKKKRARFRFSSSAAGSTFECSLDREGFEDCTSPLSLNVKRGKHRLEVRATDSAGLRDSSPAVHRWKRVRKRG